jgi:CRISPR-associated protein Csm1
MKGAKESEEEEKLAKSHECYGEIKNALSFMDTPLNWEKEFPVVESLKNKIVGLVKAKELPKSFIGKVLQHTTNAKIENHKITNLRIFWLIPYDMGRMVDRNTSIESKQLIDNYKKEVCSKQATKLNDTPIRTLYHSLELWAFAARWLNWK